MKFKKSSYLLFASMMLGATALTPLEGIDVLGDDTYVNAQSILPTASNRQVSITGAEYGENFAANGSAVINGGIATLTPDQEYVRGNTNLKTKIDMTESFTLKGKVNLGDKSKADGGADGVTFGFQPGDSSVIGGGGNGVGISGIQNAFAFKLDTYWNNASQFYSADPAEFEHSDNGNSSSFGAFVDGSTGFVNTIAEGAQEIQQPSNNQFKDVTISYNGDSKVMTVTYEGKSWSQDVSSFIDINDRMSFFIAGSTGTAYNLQQFELEQFDYTVAQGKVTTHYVDEQGNPLADDDVQSGDLDATWTTNQKDIPGYQFKEVQGNPNGTFTADDQEVTYVYSRAKATADVKYIDDNTGKTLTSQELSGEIDEKSDYTTAATIAEYENKGYELVSDDFPSDGLTFTEKDQHYVVHLKHKTTTVTPEEPGEPGTPINPVDPDGPKWPDGTDKDSLTKVVNETIHYVYEDGSTAAKDATDSVTFRHEVIVDNVTGEIITDNGWNKVDKDYFDQKDSPVIEGYTPSKTQVDKISGLTQDSDDVEETIVYTKNGEKPDTEKPDTEKPDTEKPDTEKPDTEKPDTEKPGNVVNPDKSENADKDTTTLDKIKDVVEDVFPNTGTDAKAYLSVLGGVILAITSVLFFKKRK